MYNFNFYMPARVLFGEGKLSELHEQKLPGKKALIVTSNGTSVKKYGYLDDVKHELDLAGVSYEVFDEVARTRQAKMSWTALKRQRRQDVISSLPWAAVPSWTARSALHS